MTSLALSPDAAATLLPEARQAYADLQAQDLSLDLTRGKPSAEQLDLSDAMLALPGAGNFRDEDGTDVRNYGGLWGLPQLRRIFADLLNVPVEQLLAGGNSSLTLMHHVLAYAMQYGVPGGERPWSQEPVVKIICPVPGYDRHFALCEELGIEMVTVPMTAEGPDMDAVEELAAHDPAVKGIWIVPTYSNPDGATVTEATARRLAALSTAAPDFRVIWDNAYVVHTLTTDFPKVPDVDTVAAEAGNPNRFLQVCSTSKITFAGAGVSFLSSSEVNLDGYLKHASVRTIGPNKVNQLAHARFFGDADGVRAHMLAHRESIAPKFAAADEILTRRLGEYGIASWAMPEGGYFIDLEVVDGTATETVRLAKEAGVALTPAGAAYPYGNDPDDRHIRLAPTLPPLAEVEAAMEIVGLCALLAACRAAR